MNRNIKIKIVLIVAVILACIYGIIGLPKNKAELIANWRKNIHLGLDLSGGTQLVMQVQLQDAFKGEADNVILRLKEELRKVSMDYTEMTRNDPQSLKEADGIQINVKGIPATKAGVPAITAVLAEGISVNVTLIFSVERHREVMDAYLAGLEKAGKAGHDLSKIHSVASFFVSRVDTEIDKRLEKIASDDALALRGQAGVANACLAYAAYQEVFVGGDRFAPLEADGARVQRPLWASTGVKNPEYSDTLYVTELVAPNTVNTMPEPTIDAVADHGVVTGDTVTGTASAAQEVFDELDAVGIDLTDVFIVLENEGVEKFEASWKELLDETEKQLHSADK